MHAGIRRVGAAFGASALAAVFSFAWPPPSALAFVQSRTDNGSPASWRKTSVPLIAYSQALPNMSSAQVTSAIQASVAAWTRANADVAKCSPLELPVTLAPANEEAPTGANDHKNVIALRLADWEGICHASGTGVLVCHQREELALTTLFMTGSGKIVDADIEVNAADYPWADVPSTVSDERLWDLQNALTHEVGHFVGVSHTCYWDLGEFPVDSNGDAKVPNNSSGKPVPFCGEASPAEVASTMFPSADPRDLDKRSLEPDDVAGLCSIYPFPDGCGACAVTSGDGHLTDARWQGSLAALVASALMLVVRVRRRRRDLL